MSNSTTERHSLSERDTDARTAVCSIDGPVTIRKSGTGWACAVKVNAQARETKRRNPARKHTSDSPHRLEWKDPETRSGVCPIDGPVDIVPWGGGWVCRVRATELGVTNPQDKPQGYCRDCVVADAVFVWLDAEGNCSRCAETDLNAEFAKLAADDRLMADVEDWSEAGINLVTLGDPYEMPDYESAVPGWKTIA